MKSQQKIEAGDSIDIDEYVTELRDDGYDVDYENLWAGTSGFFAEIFVNGQTHAFVEADSLTQIVKEVRRPAETCANDSRQPFYIRNADKITYAFAKVELGTIGDVHEDGDPVYEYDGEPLTEEMIDAAIEETIDIDANEG